MIRVKIRLSGEETGKVLRFDESIAFPSLLRKIIVKMKLVVSENIDDSHLTKLFQLRLGTDNVLEDTAEIEHGDDLVLTRISDGTVAAVTMQDSMERISDDSRNCHSKPAFAGTANEEGELMIEESDSDDVEEVRIESRPVGNHDVISVSSDSGEDNERDDDNDDDNEPLKDEEELNFWEEEEEGCNKYSDDLNNMQASCLHPSKKRKLKPKLPPIEVAMDEKDVPSAPGTCNVDDEIMESQSKLVNPGAGKKRTDSAVKDRIIKLLNTGFHDQSNEQEAKNAMKLAQKLMRKHNLSQALLLKEKEAESSKDEVLRGGMVRVHIVHRRTRKPSLYTRWLSQLTHPVCENFDVKAYKETRRGVKCDVVFYGIYANAQLAGYAFKVAAERIAQMTAEYKPNKPARGVSTKSSRLSYALGIVKGISEDVRQNLKREKEKHQRKLERAKWANAQGEAYEESDDEGVGSSFPRHDDMSGESRVNTPDDVASQNYEDKGVSSKLACISGVDLHSRVKELEAECQAALVLVSHNERIAEEVLKEHDIKLSAGRKRKAIDFDSLSYRRGIEDAKEIDMNQRAIRGEVKLKKEES